MCDIVWGSPQEHGSESESFHFFLQAPQWPCPVRKRFRRDHCCRGRAKPGCRIVGSSTRYALTTAAIMSSKSHQCCLIHFLMLDSCHPLKCGFPATRQRRSRRSICHSWKSPHTHKLHGSIFYRTRVNANQSFMPALCQLHWLPVCRRVDFKISTLVYRSLADTASLYLVDDCILVTTAGNHPLRSANNPTCWVKRSRNQFSNRCFATAGPMLWNSAWTASATGHHLQTIQSIAENVYVWLVGPRHPCLNVKGAD